MNPHTEIIGLTGPAGRIDIALDRPRDLPVRGIALIAHPHPLYGGTRDNKVVQTLARTLLALGYVCWRPNFRGVGESEGTHDEGQGETEDLLAVIDAARAAEPQGKSLPLILAGFSFGTLVLSRVAQRLAQAGTPAHRLIFIGTAVIRPGMLDVPADTLVLHGELDDTVPLSAVLDWARPQGLPVVVIPGADHFFHQKLTGIKDWLLRALQPTLGVALGFALAALTAASVLQPTTSWAQPQQKDPPQRQQRSGHAPSATRAPAVREVASRPVRVNAPARLDATLRWWNLWPLPRVWPRAMHRRLQHGRGCSWMSPPDSCLQQAIPT